MHLLAYSTLLLLLVYSSVHAQDDVDADTDSEGAVVKPVSKTVSKPKPPVDPDYDFQLVNVLLPPYDRNCTRSYYVRWISMSFGPYVNCRVNVGGCRRYRCGHPFFDCHKRCQPVYKWIKCGCSKFKKIKVVARCKCLPLRRTDKSSDAQFGVTAPPLMPPPQ